MPDNLTKEQRSFCMSRIRSKNTKPELIFSKKYKGLVYQPKNYFGNPDFIDFKNKIIIFVDGCFWHKCPKHYKQPKTNKNYWLPKIEKNIIRDIEINLAYKYSNWSVLRIWEHDLKNKLLF